MKIHANAPFGPKGRLTMVRRVTEQGWSLTEAAEAAGVSERTCRKWVGRYRSEGEAGLLDRSSAPNTVANRTSERRREAIAALRRLRMTGAEIAECLDVFESVPMPSKLWSCAREVQLLLAPDGDHRRVPPADLLLAAAAEAAGIPLVHYDRDYERIATVTDLQHKWMVADGSLA